jgi:hypothetical protein
MITKINPQQITHIKIYDEIKGIYSYYNNVIDCVWMEASYFHFLWFIKTNILNYSAGFYKNKKREIWSNEYPIEVGEHNTVRDNCLYTKAKIEIYFGEKQIKRMYFETFKEAKKYCIENYPEVSVTIKD